MTRGRPSRIAETVHIRDDGTKITVADRIIAALRAGNYLEPSAAAVGIDKATVYEWLKIGAAANRKLLAPGGNRSHLSHHERRCLAFNDAIAEAQAEWEVEANARLQQLASGGHTVQTVTVKVDSNGDIIERTTKTETLAPSAQVLEWRLTRKFPDRYTARTEISGPDGGAIPVEVRAANLADALRDRIAERGQLEQGDDVIELVEADG